MRPSGQIALIQGVPQANRPDLNSFNHISDLSINGGKNSQTGTRLDMKATFEFSTRLASRPVYLSPPYIGPNTVFNGFTDFLLNETNIFWLNLKFRWFSPPATAQIDRLV